MLGGSLNAFTNGLFGGAQAVQNITATNQELRQRQYGLDAAAVQAARDDPDAVPDPGGAVQPIQEQGLGASRPPPLHETLERCFSCGRLG